MSVTLLDGCGPSKNVFSQKRLVCVKITDTVLQVAEKIGEIRALLAIRFETGPNITLDKSKAPRSRFTLNQLLPPWKMLPSPVRFIFWASPCFVLSSQIPTVWSQAHPRVHEKNLQCHSWRWPHWSPPQPFRLIQWCGKGSNQTGSQVMSKSSLTSIQETVPVFQTRLQHASIWIFSTSIWHHHGNGCYGSPVYLCLSGVHVNKRVQDMDAKQAKCIQTPQNS